MADGVRRIAVVTGASRGQGYATVERLCRAFDGTVVLAARSQPRALAALARLAKKQCYPTFRQLDISLGWNRDAFASAIKDEFGGIDVLVNNAGVRFHPNHTASHRAEATSTMHVNFYSTMFLCTALFPLLREHARVVNMGSPCGHLSDIPSEELRKVLGSKELTYTGLHEAMDEFKRRAQKGEHVEKGWGDDIYCVSKVGIAAMTFIQQREFLRLRPDDDLVVNYYSPGPVISKLTGFRGSVLANESAENIVRLATLPDYVEEPVGRFVWHDFTIVKWKGKKPKS